MALSTRNPVAEELARDLSRQTGKGITQTVIEALEHELQRRRGRVRAPRIEEDLRAISARCAALPDLALGTPDEVLGYDEHGGLATW